ncbi:hypothetical protein FBZ92_10383 [Nitrospirillum viridazoti]|uniref:Uncharacterized protein n=2 Tax=Nitrospirillum TaxID=1543705 RepID=A0A560IX25_9PROT|nr:hypothetical protein FBZ92_10383 [Nitrospirillum amazonense]
MANTTQTSGTIVPLCFAIMPIAEPEGYPPQHFRRVYEDIISVACDIAGYKAIRADDVRSANLIHLDILKKLIETPIAVCDLSTRNPNVLFELGIRQAFDKPVVLIQEIGTPPIFDIGPLRYLSYSKDMRYHDVLAKQRELASAIQETIQADGEAGSVNSIVKLLALQKGASIPELAGQKKEFAVEVMHSEIQSIKESINFLIQRESMKNIKNSEDIIFIKLQNLEESFSKIFYESRVLDRNSTQILFDIAKECDEIIAETSDRTIARKALGLKKSVIENIENPHVKNKITSNEAGMEKKIILK